MLKVAAFFCVVLLFAWVGMMNAAVDTEAIGDMSFVEGRLFSLLFVAVIFFVSAKIRKNRVD